jgi:hypothetical protein
VNGNRATTVFDGSGRIRSGQGTPR